MIDINPRFPILWTSLFSQCPLSIYSSSGLFNVCTNWPISCLSLSLRPVFLLDFRNNACRADTWPHIDQSPTFVDLLSLTSDCMVSVSVSAQYLLHSIQSTTFRRQHACRGDILLSVAGETVVIRRKRECWSLLVLWRPCWNIILTMTKKMAAASIKCFYCVSLSASNSMCSLTQSCFENLKSERM